MIKIYTTVNTSPNIISYINFPIDSGVSIEVSDFSLIDDKCKCNIQDLMIQGCKCGQMERERNAQEPAIKSPCY